MQFKLNRISSLLFFLLLLISCSTEPAPSSVQRPINPNGDSELALLMRAMFEEALEVKQQLQKEETPKFYLEHEKILTVMATEPAKANSPEYKGFAQSYLQTLNELKMAGADEKMELYDDMVNQCMVCHQSMCPGPLMKIKRLK